ncbi:hypothetical protein HNQ39_002521 [Armatimonas rosea]|uniref:Recombinase domain-containing protein n=1 Tax=Armatimonas rosea TaxID=685828 RepID=A0A7W9W749_ARMRO|nr:hypothetical protein [Armatimonas rosea]
MLDLLDRKKLADICFGSGYNFENSPEGKFMLSMIFSQAKYYVDKLSHEVTEKFITRRAEGQWLSRAPEGYLNYRDPVTGRKSVIEDLERFPLLRKAFDLILLGVPPVKVLDTLNDTWGYRCRPYKKHPARPISAKRFYEVLGNPFYMGQCRFKDTTYPGIHTPMISEDEFDKVQAIFGRGRVSRRRKHEFVLRGMIRCGRCGSMVTASRAKGHVYYHCTNAHKTCDRTGVREEALEDQVLAFLARAELPEGMEAMLKQMIRELAPQHLSDQADARLRFEQEIERKQKGLERLLDLHLEGGITTKEYSQKKESLQAELVKLNAKVQGQGKPIGAVLKELDDTISFAARARQRFEEGGPTIKQSILSRFAQSMILVREDENQTGKKLLLEPLPELAPFFLREDENESFKLVESSSGKGKTTPEISEVAFGSPNEPLIKLLKQESQLSRVAYLLVAAQSSQS